ncbi:hypothetical protein MF271_20370 (plasmid) [Deinococcus sp. KNUC1210]|uniref:sensor histidine kinase n=1 Tax=Deinococcus sp. KNUC1210 TaxID=2917691 RepID=UPI001EF050D8|nr:ATP-binding protein [Deinococcus sp. KNUC1210]ULH17764.1 hypothetical protein MF271_20370 [Deinococcus sp. KNUC1210]
MIYLPFPEAEKSPISPDHRAPTFKDKKRRDDVKGSVHAEHTDAAELWPYQEPVHLTLRQVQHDVRIPPLPFTLGPVDPESSCLLVPVRVSGSACGLLMAVSSTPFCRLQGLLAEAYAGQLALTLQNRRLLADQGHITRALQESQYLITEAEERTKREISEVLHSRVQSRLLVAWYRLGEVQQGHPELAGQLDAIRTDLDNLREYDLRSISQQLHPEALRVGLVAALQVFVAQLQGMVEVVIDVDEHTRQLDDPLSNKLPHPLRLMIFRSIEEAIGNVLKHAQASRVEVSLSYTDMFRLEVSDNGRGFDPAEITPGLGLLCLAARVESSGGFWGLNSRPGGPTSLWAEVPL